MLNLGLKTVQIMGALDLPCYRGRQAYVISPRSTRRRWSYPDGARYRSLVSRHCNPSVCWTCGSCPDRLSTSRAADYCSADHYATSAMAPRRGTSRGLWPRLAAVLLWRAARRRPPDPMSLVPSEPVVAGMYIPRSSGATCSRSRLWSGPAAVLLWSATRRRPLDPMSLVPSEPVVAVVYISLSSGATCTRGSATFGEYAKFRPAIRQPACSPCCDRNRPASLLRSGCEKALRWDLQEQQRCHQMPERSSHGTFCNVRFVFQRNAGGTRRPKKCAENHDV
jgi:hypothetical protein